MQALEPFEVQRARCETSRDALAGLARIHVEVDAPMRRIGSDEPDWVFRLRKVCLHAVAITKCEVDADGVHVITTELRAAYEQMDAVWGYLPDEFRFEADRGWWRAEAKDSLAAYNHPTTVSLMLGLWGGGFDGAEDPRSYLRLASWLGRLGCAYSLALAHLARVLGKADEVDARLLSVLRKLSGSAPAAAVGSGEGEAED